MASHRIATVDGVFLRPGLSKNNRLYTKENIGKAVSRIQEKLAGGTPVTMYTRHREADADNALTTVGRVTSVRQLDDGSAAFEADIANTSAGRDIAALVTPKNPYLKGVSIRGAWVGDLKTIEANGKTATTADDLDIDGIDYTSRPGVEGAGITGGNLLESAPDPRTIFESLDELHFTEEDVEEEGSTDTRLSEAVEALQGVVDALAEGGNAPGDGKKPYGNTKYADPGYQSDKKKRYPIDTAAHVRAAWAYINKSKNAGAYSSQQLARIKSRIKSAAKKFGINITEETQQFIDDITDLLEAYASMTLSNGDGSVSVSGYTDDSGKLSPVAHRIAYSAIAALHALDPDEDGDIDLIMPDGSVDSSSSEKPADKESQPNGTESPDDDMESSSVCTCGATVPQGTTICPTCGEPVPQAEAAPTTDTEAQVADDTQTNAAQTTESGLAGRTLTDADIAALAEAMRAGSAASTTEASNEASTDATTSTPEAAAPVTYTAEQVDEMVKKAAKKAAKEAASQVRQEAQEAIRQGGFSFRKGLVSEDAETQEDVTASDLARMTREERLAYEGQAWLSNPVVAELTHRSQQRVGNPLA